MAFLDFFSLLNSRTWHVRRFCLCLYWYDAVCFLVGTSFLCIIIIYMCVVWICVWVLGLIYVYVPRIIDCLVLSNDVTSIWSFWWLFPSHAPSLMFMVTVSLDWNLDRFEIGYPVCVYWGIGIPAVCVFWSIFMVSRMSIGILNRLFV